MLLRARSRSTRRRIIACSTSTSPKWPTRSSRCWKISPSRSRPIPPPSAISSSTRPTTSNTRSRVEGASARRSCLGKVNVDLVALLAIQVLYAIASLALISVGLAIIFGMMRVINLANGEFLMLGVYAAIVATSHGISIWIAMLVVAPIVVGIIGVVIERTIIRFLYGRMIDTMLATWGLSLFLVGLTTAIFGNTTVGISAPLGSFQIGAYRTSVYTLFVIAVATGVLASIFVVMRWTRLGLLARGTMQNANMAAALGGNPPRGSLFDLL